MVQSGTLNPSLIIADDPRTLAQSMLGLRRAHQAFELRALRVRQNNSCRFRDALHRNLESRLTQQR